MIEGRRRGRFGGLPAESRRAARSVRASPRIIRCLGGIDSSVPAKVPVSSLRPPRSSKGQRPWGTQTNSSLAPRQGRHPPMRRFATSGRAAACLPSVPVAHLRRQAPLRFWGQLRQLERRHEDFNNGGHTLAGTFSLDWQVGEHLAFGISYARMYQSYANVPALSAVPNRNRVWLSLSYRFMRPIGR